MTSERKMKAKIKGEKSLKVFVRTATVDDVPNFLKRLRKADRKEILNNSGLLPKQSLIRGINLSKKSFSIVEQGRVLGMFGVATIRSTPNGKIGSPWMVGSDELFKRHVRRFLSEYQEWIAEISRDYYLLENYVFAENTTHIRWIKWAGFELTELIEEFGRGQVPFWHFEMRC